MFHLLRGSRPPFQKQPIGELGEANTKLTRLIPEKYEIGNNRKNHDEHLLKKFSSSECHEPYLLLAPIRDSRLSIEQEMGPYRPQVLG